MKNCVADFSDVFRRLGEGRIIHPERQEDVLSDELVNLTPETVSTSAARTSWQRLYPHLSPGSNRSGSSARCRMTSRVGHLPPVPSFQHLPSIGESVSYENPAVIVKRSRTFICRSAFLILSPSRTLISENSGIYFPSGSSRPSEPASQRISAAVQGYRLRRRIQKIPLVAAHWCSLSV